MIFKLFPLAGPASVELVYGAAQLTGRRLWAAVVLRCRRPVSGA